MSEHLKRATSGYAKRLSDIDKAAAALARQQEADHARDALAFGQTPTRAGDAGTDNGGSTNATHA